MQIPVDLQNHFVGWFTSTRQSINLPRINWSHIYKFWVGHHFYRPPFNDIHGDIAYLRGWCVKSISQYSPDDGLSIGMASTKNKFKTYIYNDRPPRMDFVCKIIQPHWHWHAINYATRTLCVLYIYTICCFRCRYNDHGKWHIKCACHWRQWSALQDGWVATNIDQFDRRNGGLLRWSLSRGSNNKNHLVIKQFQMQIGASSIVL